MYKLKELEDQMKILLEQENQIFIQIQEATSKRGKLMAEFEAQKDGKQMLIETCQRSRPPGYNPSKSFPHVLMENDPHAQFMNDKERLESGYRRDLEHLQQKQMVALIVPNAEIRDLEKQESDIKT